METKKQDTLPEEDGYLTVDLPKSTLILVFGIMSIVLCFAYGIVGLVFGIIALSRSKKSIELYKLAPELYTKTSYRNIQAGKTCATIGVIFSSIGILLALVYYVVKGAFLTIF